MLKLEAARRTLNALKNRKMRYAHGKLWAHDETDGTGDHLVPKAEFICNMFENDGPPPECGCLLGVASCVNRPLITAKARELFAEKKEKGGRVNGEHADTFEELSPDGRRALYESATYAIGVDLFGLDLKGDSVHRIYDYNDGVAIPEGGYFPSEIWEQPEKMESYRGWKGWGNVLRRIKGS